MKFNERRTTAAALASSASLLAALGLARGIEAIAEEQTVPAPSRALRAGSRNEVAQRTPSSLLIVRRSHPVIAVVTSSVAPSGAPASSSVPVGTASQPSVVTAPPPAPVAAPPAPPAPVPVTRSS